MIFDKQGLFSEDQAVTTGTIVSTNVIDHGAVGTPQHAANALDRDLGKGTKPKIRVQVTETFVGGTSVQLVLQQSVDEAFTSPIVVRTGAVIAVASLVAGYVFDLEVFPIKTTARFTRLTYVVDGTHTAGKVFAGLVYENEERVV